MSGRRIPTPFGRAIKVRLAELNMQQRDLARLLGTSNAYVTYLIYGDRREEAWVARICAALDMPPPCEEADKAANANTAAHALDLRYSRNRNQDHTGA